MSGNSKNERQSALSMPNSLDLTLKSVEDQYHSSLLELSNSKPALLVFLRHFGCCFCREALADIRFSLPAIEAAGARVVIVHMSSEAEASQILATYGLADLPRISNPDRSLYKAFGLRKGNLASILAPKVVFRAIEAILNGNLIGTNLGDLLQMHGLLVIHKGKMLQSFAPESVEIRPDYVKIASSTNALARR